MIENRYSLQSEIETGADQAELRDAYTVESLTDTGIERGWRIEIDGEQIDAGLLVLDNPELGITMTYGRRPEGYDGPVLREEHGGVVMVPYFVDGEGDLYIGVVRERRLTVDEPSQLFNVPRGMKEAGELSEKSAAREYEEETGLEAASAATIKLATSVNASSTFFDTTRGGGADFYASKFLGQVVRNDEGHYEPAQGASSGVAEKDENEDIVGGLVFMPASEAMSTPDMFTHAAIAMVYNHLNKGKWQVASL